MYVYIDGGLYVILKMNKTQMKSVNVGNDRYNLINDVINMSIRHTKLLRNILNFCIFYISLFSFLFFFFFEVFNENVIQYSTIHPEINKEENSLLFRISFR